MEGESHHLSSQTLIKIFIGGLPPAMTKADISQMFGRWGKVQVTLKMRDDGIGNAGYGFIIVNSLEQAERILSENYSIGERKLHVEFGRKSSKNFRPPRSGRVFLRNIPPGTTDNELTAEIQKICNCTMAYSIRTPEGATRGFGFAELATVEDAEELLCIGLLYVQGKAVSVLPFKSSTSSLINKYGATGHHSPDSPERSSSHVSNQPPNQQNVAKVSKNKDCPPTKSFRNLNQLNYSKKDIQASNSTDSRSGFSIRLNYMPSGIRQSEGSISRVNSSNSMANRLHSNTRLSIIRAKPVQLSHEVSNLRFNISCSRRM